MSSIKLQEKSWASWASSSAVVASSSTSSPSSTVTIKFNIGGTIYEVSKSLLDMYPDTMLSTAASKRWNQDDDGNDTSGEEGEVVDGRSIFIDRSDYRFQFVLDYMRDNGLVFLPLDVPFEAFKNDLIYYNFDVTVPGALSNVCVGSIAAYVKSYKFLNKVYDSTTKFLETCQDRRVYQCTALAQMCFREYMRERLLEMKTSDPNLLETAIKVVEKEDWKAVFENVLEERFRLKLVSIEFFGSYRTSCLVYFAFID